MLAAPCLPMALQRGIVGIFAVFLSACAANPYSTVTSVEPAAGIGKYHAVDLPTAMSKLSEYREDYRAKRRAEFDRQQQLSTGLFGLGALALTLGAYGAHRDAITGVAIAGATTYQGGMWNTAPGRNAIYGAGIQALDCGVAIMAPALAALDRTPAVQTWRTGLGERAGALLAARAKLTAITVTSPLSGNKRNAYLSLIDSATMELIRAQAAENRASSWTTMISGS